MLIPSIDIRGGQAVQLVNGKALAGEYGDPLPIAEKFSLIGGPTAVIDLDGAFGDGRNDAIIGELVSRYDCVVGGGIRTPEAARRWLDAGARAVILGTAATPEILRQLPKERVIAALDAFQGRVVQDAWRTVTDVTVEDRIIELRDLVGGFLFTLVEREGMLQGTDLERARKLVELAKPARVTIAGGITTTAEVSQLDQMGADAQVGMALYTGRFSPVDALLSILCSDRPDGLFPTVIQDISGESLGLAYSDGASLREAVATRRGVYHSRKRGLWKKGEGSGNHQDLLRIDVDCDRDALRFLVRQHGEGFCHTGTWTCFGDDHGLGALERKLRARLGTSDPASYTARLFRDPQLLGDKLKEEAGELAEAVAQLMELQGAKGRVDAEHIRSARNHAVWEASDLAYFLTAAMVRAGITWQDVEKELARRSGARRNQRETKV